MGRRAGAKRVRIALLLGVLLLLACSSGASHSPRRAEGSRMGLKLEFRILTPNVVFQESPACLFTLVNDGPTAIRVVHPSQAENLPFVKFRNARTGKEFSYEVPPESWVPPDPRPLAPGARIEWGLDLESRGRIPEPGEYDVSIRYPWDQDRMAESEPQRLHVAPSTPSQLAFATVNGATGPIQNAAWVNTGTHPARLVRGTFTLSGGEPKLQEVRSLGPVSAGARPQVSTPANGQVSRDHWIAWIDGGKLYATHYGEGHETLPALEVGLPWGDAQLVGSLHTAPLEDPKVPPPGTALVWHATSNGSQLSQIRLTAKGLAVGESMPIAGTRPLWLESVGRSRGDQVVLYVQRDGPHLQLRWLTWGKPAARALPHAEWAGDLIASDAVITPQDGVHGALLILLPAPAGARRELRLIQWELNAEDQGREVRRDAIDTSRLGDLAHAEVRVSSQSAVVLLRGKGGTSQLWRSGAGSSDLSRALGSSDLPLAVAFSTEFDPVLLHAVRERGWELLQLDGTPFEPAHEH